MDAKDAIKKVEESRVFLRWREKNKKDYLVNAFIMFDAQTRSPWQVGYYDNESDKITTFNIADEVTQSPESEVFKKKKTIKPLSISKVKITLVDVLEKAKKHQEGKYPGNWPTKQIVVLQNLDKGQMYNITFITQTFNTLNIKISADDGHVISDKLTSLMDMQRK